MPQKKYTPRTPKQAAQVAAATTFARLNIGDHFNKHPGTTPAQYRKVDRTTSMQLSGPYKGQHAEQSGDTRVWLTWPVTQQHATKKKSAAQLQREIDEALANTTAKCPSAEHPLYPQLRHIRQVAHDTSWGASQLAKDAEEAFRNGDCPKAAVMLEAAKRAIAKERRKRR